MSRNVQVASLTPKQYASFRQIAKARQGEAHAAREVFAAGLAALAPAELPARELLAEAPEVEAPGVEGVE